MPISKVSKSYSNISYIPTSTYPHRELYQGSVWPEGPLRPSHNQHFPALVCSGPVENGVHGGSIICKAQVIQRLKTALVAVSVQGPTGQS